MRAVVCILMLVGAQAFKLKPKVDIKFELFSSLAQKLRQSSGNCRELSVAFGELAEHALAIVPYAVGATGSVNVASRERTELAMNMLFGFDIINDDAAREAYTCAIKRAGSLSELKAKLENNNLLPNLFRMMYDSGVIGIQMKKKQSEIGRQLLEFVKAVESVGLLDLDSVRVEQLKKMVREQLGPVLVGYKPTPPFAGSIPAKCAHVNKAFRRLFNTLDLEPVQKALVQQMIGIDISDNLQMQSLICNIIDGAEGGVAGLYAVLDSRGIFSSIFKSVYPLIQTYVPLGRATLEQVIQEEIAEGAPNYGGIYPGNSAQTIKVMSDVVRFLRVLERSGLLSLANDL